MEIDEFRLLAKKCEEKGPIENTLRHFGYLENTENTECRGHWDKSEYAENFLHLPEFINLRLKHKQFRLVFDYDPNYPNTLIQIFKK